MPTRTAPTVVVLAARGTLDGMDARLAHAGVRLRRITSVEARPLDPRRWLHRLTRTPGPDTAVLTSRAAVSAGVRPWRRRQGPLLASVEFWAVGPETARALREEGVRGIHRPPTSDALAIVRALGRRPRRTIAYLRSDIAGPRLSRALRSRGHRVVDVVVYRLRTPPRLSPRAQRDLVGADLLVVTSPSGLEGLRRRMSRPAFARLARSARLVVLGERSRRAALRLGFRSTSVAPSTNAQRLTRHLLREIRNARA
jgi:uroporphyrinogen-III synthase